jgi:hypothetical protein
MTLSITLAPKETQAPVINTNTLSNFAIYNTSKYPVCGFKLNEKVSCFSELAKKMLILLFKPKLI